MLKFGALIHFRIYDDVITALKHWTSNNIKIYIYSSGSVDAQKLLFGNSKFGDLLQVQQLVHSVHNNYLSLI